VKKFLSGFIVAVGMVALVSTGWAGMIEGTLSKIDGSNYIVKDAKGKEHKIHFDDTTKKEGEVKEGAKVTVDEAKGHAKSIKVAADKK
jgi:putative sterol carrier protein